MLLVENHEIEDLCGVQTDEHDEESETVKVNGSAQRYDPQEERVNRDGSLTLRAIPDDREVLHPWCTGWARGHFQHTARRKELRLSPARF